MAIQSNYFAYNIIDDIYYGTPAEDEMVDIYGKYYHRRNEFNNLTPEEKENFNNEEKEFIQAVINKYVTGNNKNTSYIGKYNENTNVSYTYINGNSYMPIQISDMISNVNGMHLYKLISAKDIDFDNVVLPNSIITRDYNWGIFDEKRRWGNKPIHINNTFELLNVIDYLLCACNNIWNELYKLKYKEDDTTNIWFVTKADSPLMILESRKIAGDDFRKEFVGKHEVKLLTTLDPTSFYSTVKTINNGLFGFGTNFHKTETDINDLYFQYRILNTKASKNIIMGDIEFESLVNQPNASTSQTVNGELYTIYGYKIGDDLKIYPGERIKSFINESCLIFNKQDIENIVDNNKKQLKYDTYFRISKDEYKQVHIEFLYNYETKTSDNKNLQSTIKHPYILYYINNFNKKQVLYVHTLSYEEVEPLLTTFPDTNYLMSELSILGNLNLNNEYDVSYLYDSNSSTIIPALERFRDTNGIFSKDLNIKLIKESEESTDYINIPIFYIIPDEYSLEFEVTLPKTNTAKGIIIYYYKNENNIKGNIYILKDREHIVTNEELKNIETNENFTEIVKNVDIDQELSISYCLERYNIPENHDIYLKINATYIADGNNDNDEENNPLHLKLSDEYRDVALYTDNLNSENITDSFAQSYYYYDSISNTNEYKRNFYNYQTAQFFKDNIIRYINYDLKGFTFYHVWEKINNPYKALYEITTNSFIMQNTTKNDLENEISQININQLSYNLFKFNHTLDEDVEQIKFDIDFKINETSKVKKCQYKFPINLNKIYNLSINYIGSQIINNESQHYVNEKYNYRLKREGNIFNVTLGDIYLGDIGKAKYLQSLLDIQSASIAYTNVIQELNNVDLDDISNPLSYDNTDSNDKIFNISYNNYNKYINLFGSFYTGKKIEDIRYANISIGNHSLQTNSTYIFNINGFGKNYRLHGYNDFINYTDQSNILTLSSYFDLLSVQTSSPKNSINTFLNIKLQEDNNEQYQLSYISYSLKGGKSEWTKYDNDFKTGLETDNDYIIKTIPVDIIKSTYSMTLHNMEEGHFNEDITYYIPISYMYINSSTFYPPLNSIPSNKEYDFNNETDINRYKNYVECWNTESNYRPITLSFKLLENSNHISPYFYESNEAKMRFNILRSDDLRSTLISITGKQETIFVSLDSRYYISDFIEYSDTQQQQNSIKFPSGSYFYYNEETYSYMIKEIYGNYSGSDTLQINEDHDEHYKTINNSDYINKQYITNKFPEITTVRKTFVYPIFHKSKNDTNYNYDIYRISDINKIILKNEPDISNQIHIRLSDSTGNNTRDFNDCINVDYNLKYIDFTSENLEEFKINNNTNNNIELGKFTIKIPILTGLYSSKNYNYPQQQTVEGGYRVTSIVPIYRIKNNNKFGLDDYSNLYPTVNIGDQVYEFFIFIYDDIYLLAKNKQTDKIEQREDVTLFKKTIENVQDDSEENIPSLLELQSYYEEQLYYFLNPEDSGDEGNYYLLCNSSTILDLIPEEENNEED